MAGYGAPAGTVPQSSANSEMTVREDPLRPGCLWVKSTPDPKLVDTNRVYVSRDTLARHLGSSRPVHVVIEPFVFLAEEHPGVPPDSIALNAVHRRLVRAEVSVSLYAHKGRCPQHCGT